MNIQKLSNGFIYTSSQFQAVFAEYLFQNGFAIEQKWNQLHFTKGELKLVVMNDNMDVFTFNARETDLNQQWEFSHQLEDFSTMDIAEFMWTMDVSKITSIADFADNASALGKQYAIEAQILLRAVSRTKYFQPANI